MNGNAKTQKQKADLLIWTGCLYFVSQNLLKKNIVSNLKKKDVNFQF